MKFLTFFLCIIYCASSIASPTSLEKGQPAPYTGVLFTKDQELKLREINESHFFLLKKVELLENSGGILESQVKLFSDHSDNLSKQLVQTQDRSFWRNVAFFGLGILVTVGSSYAINQAVNR